MRLLNSIGILVGVVVALRVTAFFLHNLTPPSFNVRQIDGEEGRIRLEINPNFVVNYVRDIWVDHSGKRLVAQKGVFDGRQIVELPGDVEKGDTLTVKCRLQFDRWIVPCIDRVERRFVVKCPDILVAARSRHSATTGG